MPIALKMTQLMTARNSGIAMREVAGNCSNGMIPEMFSAAMKKNRVAR